jgi:hypothetical protein
MWAGRNFGPVGASVFSGSVSVPMRGVRGTPAGAPSAHRMVRTGGAPQRLARDLGQFLERCGQFWSAAGDSLISARGAGRLELAVSLCAVGRSPAGLSPAGVFYRRARCESDWSQRVL